MGKSDGNLTNGVKPSSTTPILKDPQATTPWRTNGNPNIKEGFISPKATVKDIFHPSPLHHHNETINIYSHFLGFIFFGIAGLTYPYYGSRKMTNTDLVIMNVYCAGVCICFGLSTFHHAFGHKSQLLYNRSRQLDILGISVLMGGAGPAMVYYGLHGNSTLQTYYFAATGIVWAATAFILATKETSIPTRLKVLSSLAMPGLAAVIHGIFISANSEYPRALRLRWILGTLGLNVSGALFYTTQFPEKYIKGRFDVHGASHQIFHTLIVGAAVTFWWGIVEAVKRIRDSNGLGL